MSETDWWQDLYGESGSVATSEPERATLAGSAAPERNGTHTPGHVYAPPPSRRWGSGRSEPDPFLAANPAHGGEGADERGDTTPDEAAELERHRTTQRQEQPRIPPMPTRPPTAGAPEGGEKDEKADKKKETEKESGPSSSSEKQPGKKEAALKAVQATSEAVVDSFSGGWCFLWSLGAAWTIPVTFPVALLDRIAVIFGSPRPVSGSEPMNWDLLHGPGLWFEKQLETYGDDGNFWRMAVLASVGVVPILFSQFGEKISTHALRKALGWICYGFPIFFICMPSYFDSLGFHSAEDLYMTTLAASTWWGFTFGRTLETGFCKFLLHIPLAATIVGIGHYAPGAAF